MANELAVEQEDNLFSTQPVLDPKPNRSMSILKHINRDRRKTVQSKKPMSILDHIHLHEENKFNNEPNKEVCELNDYRRYRDKLIREQLAEYSHRREKVESYSEDKCDDESLCLDEVFQDNLDTHMPPRK